MLRLSGLEHPDHVRSTTRSLAAAAALALAILTAAACGSDRSSAGPERGAPGRNDVEDIGRGGRPDPGSGDAGTGSDAGSDAEPDGQTSVLDVSARDTGDAAAADTSTPDTSSGRGGIVTADPTSIFMTYSGAGVVIDEPIRVINTSDVPVTVIGVELVDPDPGFVIFDDPVELELAPGAETVFTLRFESTEASTASVSIHVRTSIGVTLIVPVTATEKAGGGVEPPCVDVRPIRIDFGRVERGAIAPAPRPVAITNCGDTEIVVSRLDRASVLFLPTPASFQWTSDRLPIVLAPGAVTEVTVTYAPGRVGRESGGIDVRTNVPGSETVRVQLLAESVLPPITELDVHLLLRWDVSGGSDVDFHFLAEGAELFSCADCYFGNMTPDWGVAGVTIDDPFLDVDDLEGPGPENINVDELAPGRYRIVVHYYSDTGSGGGGDGGSPVATNATVDVYLGGVLRATYGPKRLSRTNQTWNVATLDWPAGTLTELGDVYSLGSRGSCLGGF